MRYSEQARRQLTEKFEGCRLSAYQDSGGVWTIGYGHIAQVEPGVVCTSLQADAWLASDLTTAERIVNSLVCVPLTQNEFDALVDFVFNCGPGNFQHSTLLRLINNGKYHQAAGEFEKWDRCGGKEIAGLLRRRKAEETLFLDGVQD